MSLEHAAQTKSVTPNSRRRSLQPDVPAILKVSENVLFEAYKKKYLQTLHSMTEMSGRRFGYSLRNQTAHSRTILIDHLIHVSNICIVLLWNGVEWVRFQYVCTGAA